MQIYYSIVMFIMGSCFGSFYNVVGYRTPRDMSIIKPSSHCTSCNHPLKILDLFPIFSYLFLRGKCRYCKAKVGLFYPIFETITGVLFVISYLLYGFSIELLIALTFISLLLIIMISDYQTMVIPDSVLLVMGAMLVVELFLQDMNITKLLIHLGNGFIAFGLMLALKLFGDFLFKKESMGGGDIKLMFIIGMVLGWQSSILTVLFSSFIALPPALILYNKNSSHEIPYGPFLAMAAIIIMLSGIDMKIIIDMLMI